jgi:guanylate kinase
MKCHLVIISAPSGAGKTSIANYLLMKNPNLEFSVSATTRKPRGNEVNGKEYYFISVNEFRDKIRNGEFVEWQEVYKNQFYGTLKSEVERIWKKNCHAVFDVDVKGGINLKNIFGTRAISIFIMPPSAKDLEERLISRGTEDRSKIRMRIEKAMEEMKLANQFDQIVVNDDLVRVQNEVYKIVDRFINERC